MWESVTCSTRSGRSMPATPIVAVSSVQEWVQRVTALSPQSLRKSRSLAYYAMRRLDAGDYRTFEALESLREHLDGLARELRVLHDRMDLPSAAVQ